MTLASGISQHAGSAVPANGRRMRGGLSSPFKSKHDDHVKASFLRECQNLCTRSFIPKECSSMLYPLPSGNLCVTNSRPMKLLNHVSTRLLQIDAAEFLPIPPEQQLRVLRCAQALTSRQMGSEIGRCKVHCCCWLGTCHKAAQKSKQQQLCRRVGKLPEVGLTCVNNGSCRQRQAAGTSQSAWQHLRSPFLSSGSLPGALLHLLLALAALTEKLTQVRLVRLRLVSPLLGTLAPVETEATAKRLQRTAARRCPEPFRGERCPNLQTLIASTVHAVQIESADFREAVPQTVP